MSRETLTALGIAAVAIGLAERLAFFTWVGFALVVGGFLLIFLAARVVGLARGSPRIYVLLFFLLAVIAALAPFRPGPRDIPLLLLGLCSPVLFLICTEIPKVRQLRVYATAAPLIAAHAYFIKLVPSPEHQDVFKFLNLGVDALAQGHNPYAQQAYKFTYPPGVLGLVAPFRLVLGDIRWSYIAAEIVVTLLLVYLVRRQSRVSGLAGWQVALIALPLALPRVGEAFYVYSNHEWLLLALALIALLLAVDGHWVWAGLVLGLGIASKQYFIAFPALFLLPVVRWRSLALALVSAVVVLAPFLVWDAHALLVSLAGDLGATADPTRITVWAALKNVGLATGRAGAELLALAGIVVAVGLFVSARRRLSESVFACGLALAAISLGAPFAAYNYYAYALTFCIWGLLLQGGTTGAAVAPALEASEPKAA
jgi:hypothetical protein